MRADTAVAITAGTGTNVDTRTEGTNGNHRQVIVIGDPATNAGVAPVDGTAGLKVDLGSDNDITGTVTANLGATDNAVLDSIDTSTQGILADTAAIQTAVETLDNAISGSEMQVDIVGSLPAGTAAIGKLAANSGVDIGDVDVTSTVLTTDRTSSGSIDANSESVAIDCDGASYVAVQVTGTWDGSLSGYATLDDTNWVNVDGHDRVNSGNLIWDFTANGLYIFAVAGYSQFRITSTSFTSGTAAVTLRANQGSNNFSTSIVYDGDSFVSNSDRFMPVAGQDGSNFQAITTDSSGHLQVDVLTAPTTTVQGTVTANLGATDNAVLDDIAADTEAIKTAVEGTLTVGSHAVTNAGTFAVQISDTSFAVADGNALGEGVLIQGDDGTDRKNINVDATTGDVQVDVTNTVTVDLGANNDVTVTGTVDLGATDNAVLDTIDAVLDTINAKLVTGTDIGDVTINNASGASAVNIQDGGNTITVDGTVTANLAAGTNNIGDIDVLSIAAGDNNIGNVDLASAIPAGTNAIGKVIPPDYDVTSHTAKAVKYYTNAGAVTDGIIWSPAAGKRWHVTTLFINVSAAATVTLEDDLAGGDSAIMKMELAANSGVAIPFGDMYPLTSGEDAADLIITTSAGNVYVTAVGYEI